MAERKKKDFEYRQLKQDYFIRDLKRKNIQTVEVETYDDIAILLEKVATHFKRSSIFMSGAASEFGAWKPNQAESFLHDLSADISADQNRIITGFGVGIGGAIINGALERLDKAGIAISEEHLMMRPFPHTASGKPASKGRWTDYRRSMIEHAGIAIFVFGNKKDAGGTTVDSTGMREEFDLCVASGVAPIPVGATGFMAEKLWKEVEGRFAHYFPNAPASIRKSFATIGATATRADVLKSEILKIIHHLQKG